MFEEPYGRSRLPSDDDSRSRTGRAPENRTRVAFDENAASEQATNDEWIRDRNKRGRAPRGATGPGARSSFTNHS
jgi:hypothetical protein